jgi:hypothetical protein
MHSYPYNWDQHQQLERVSESIGEIIMEFYFSKRLPNSPKFTANELLEYVMKRCTIAPESATRVLRNYRQQGRLMYVVIDRKNSQYEFLY